MPASIVTRNFLECLSELKTSRKVKSDREFALALDFTPQNLSQISKGKRDVTIELVRKAVEVFGFNANFIFTGEGDGLNCSEKSNSSGICYSQMPYVSKDSYQFYIEYLKEGFKPNMPSLQYQSASERSEARIFEFLNHDLSPYINTGDKLLCKRIQESRWGRLLRNHNIYVVVAKEDIYISRIVNKLSKSGELILILDRNVDAKSETLLQSEVLEVWEITHIISRWSSDLNDESLTIKEKLNFFQNTMDENVDSIKEMNRMLQKVLKHNRDQLKLF